MKNQKNNHCNSDAYSENTPTKFLFIHNSLSPLHPLNKTLEIIIVIIKAAIPLAKHKIAF